MVLNNKWATTNVWVAFLDAYVESFLQIHLHLEFHPIAVFKLNTPTLNFTLLLFLQIF